MLPLDDPRWDEFETIYEGQQGGLLSVLVREWWDSSGFDHEFDRYSLLMRQVVNQGSITASAYALVPYLVTLCEQQKTPFNIEYLTAVAWIEMSRIAAELSPPAMPDFLRDDYQDVMKILPDVVDEAIDNAGDAARTRGLRALKPALHGNWRLAWKRWTGQEFQSS